MYLDEVKPRTQPAVGHCGETVDSDAPASLPGGKWQSFPNSRISHHGAACCEIAHAWLLAFDFAQLNGGNRLAGPRWMREHSTWGPTAWPVHWCEAVDAKVVDCGVHAAMAHEAFTARGLTAFVPSSSSATARMQPPRGGGTGARRACRTTGSTARPSIMKAMPS
jgi:hypothetical protein